MRGGERSRFNNEASANRSSLTPVRRRRERVRDDTARKRQRHGPEQRIPHPRFANDASGFGMTTAKEEQRPEKQVPHPRSQTARAGSGGQLDGPFPIGVGICHS